MYSIDSSGDNPLKLLIITPYLPHSKVGHGGGVSVRALVAQMATRHEVTLFSLIRPGEQPLISKLESEMNIKVIPFQFNDIHSKWTEWPRLISDRAISLIKSFFSGYPYYAEKYSSTRIDKTILDVIQTVKPDVIHVEYLQMSLLLKAICQVKNNTGFKVPNLLIGTHELGSLPRQRRLQKARNPLIHTILRLQVKAWRKLQLDVTSWANHTLCVTDQDRDLLVADGGKNCRTIPLGIDTDLIKPVWEQNNSKDLLFIGSFEHPPNRTCAKFLIDKIWPFVTSYRNEGSLTIVGRGSEQFLKSCEPTPDSVSALGFVENLDKLYRKSQLFVAPLLEGGGIKIKILEAMAYGIPVVTTPIGAEGIVDQSDNALFISSPDGSFADSVLQALNDPEESAKRANKASMVIEERFGWSAIADLLTNLYETR
jgi:polysaccharide biosynthesis protein PslH